MQCNEFEHVSKNGYPFVSVSVWLKEEATSSLCIRVGKYIGMRHWQTIVIFIGKTHVDCLRSSYFKASLS